jgi:hypothetical protein
MSKPARWKGELAKPIRVTVNRPQGFAVPDQRDPVGRAKVVAENAHMCRLRDQARAEAETLKLALLARHYQIPVNDFRALALALARDFVPGFQFRDPLIPLTHCGPQYRKEVKSGRPRLWDFDRGERLLSAVEALATNGLTQREALKRLARQKEWSAPENHRGGFSQWVETLESRLHHAKRLRRWADALENKLRKIPRETFAEEETDNSGNPPSDC